MKDEEPEMIDVFEYLMKDIPTWKVILIDKWTDFKAWFYSLFIR